MPVDAIVVKGVQTNATANFVGFVPSVAPKYKIYTPNSKTVASGNAALIGSDWVATFTIPMAAPLTANNERYLLVWEASNGNQNYRIQEQFSVSDGVQAAPTDAAVVAVENTAFKVEFVSPLATIPNASIRIVFAGFEYPDYSALASSLTGIPIAGGSYKYYFDIPALPNLNTANVGYRPSWAVINYVDGNAQEFVEYQPVYFVNLNALNFMNKVRRLVDRLRNKDIIPQLRITELDLIHFVIEGIDRVNATPNTNVTIGLGGMGIPASLSHYVTRAASIILLRSQYLAEGMASFDFSGLSVTLNSDRTQYIQSMIDGLENEMQDLKEVKTALAKSGYSASGRRVGTLGTFIGPLRNYGGVAQISGGYSANMVYGGYPSLPFWI